MRGLIALCLLAWTADADAARRPSRYVPEVSVNEHLERDPDRRQEPDKPDLHHHILHLQDLITDRNVKKEQHQGLEFFMDRLQRRLKQNGSDKPRFDILRNAQEAWEVLRQGRDALREAYLPLHEAQKILLETYGVLEGTLENMQAGAGASEAAAQEMQTVVDGMQADAEPPESVGPEAQTADLHSIEPMEPYLNPLDERIEEASRLLQRARTRFETARQLVYIVNTFAERAGELDAAAAQSLSESRTARTTRAVENDDSSHVQIDNTNRWLDKSAKLAKQAHKKLEDYVRPRDGKLRKAVAAAKKADGALLEAKQTGLETGERINGAHRMISRQLRRAWQQMEQMPDGPPKEERKAQIKEQAAQAAEQAAQANAGEQKAHGKAAKEFAAASKAKEEAGKDLEQIFELLGDGEPGDHTDILGYQITAPAPRQGSSIATGRPAGGQKKVRSKPLKYPKVLNDDAGNVIQDQYGEGTYGLPD